MRRTLNLLMTILVILVVSLLGFVSGCNEQQVVDGVKPLSGHLIPTKQEWKDTYGDNIGTQTAFNLAVIRYDQQQIFNLVQSYHPPIDPNEVVDVNEVSIKEIDDSWPCDSLLNQSQIAGEFRDVRRKINEIINAINDPNK